MYMPTPPKHVSKEAVGAGGTLNHEVKRGHVLLQRVNCVLQAVKVVTLNWDETLLC